MNVTFFKRSAQQALLLAALAIIPAAGALAWVGRAPAGGMLEPHAAIAWQKTALWVDARRQDEYDAGHVPGAVRLSEDDWDANLPAILQAWRPGQKVIVYCNGGACQASKEVAARLRDAGVSPVYVLRGGWPEWKRANGPQ